jgi:hypothetical protein
MNIHEPLPRAAAVYVDFNQDFMHSRTGSIGIAVLVPLSISISISIRKIDIVEQYLAQSIRAYTAVTSRARAAGAAINAIIRLSAHRGIRIVCDNR